MFGENDEIIKKRGELEQKIDELVLCEINDRVLKHLYIK